MTPLTDTQRREVEALAPRVRVLVWKLYGAREWPAFTQEDVFQSAMLAVCRARHLYQPDRRASFSTYALTRARGAILDFLRQQRPGSRDYPAANPLSLDARLSEDREATFLDRLAYDDPDPPDSLLEAQLWGAIDRLPGRAAVAFRLVAEGGLRVTEAGAVMGVSEGRIQQLLATARARLEPEVDRLLAPVAA